MKFSEMIRHRQQIVRIASIDATPAKMIGEPRGLCSFYQTLKTFLMLPVEFISRAEIHRYPVLDDTTSVGKLDKKVMRERYSP